MKKTVLILWIVAALFLVSSVPLFAQGSIAAGVCGVAIAAVLLFVGYRKKQAAPKQEAKSSTPAAACSTASTSTKEKPAMYSQEGFDFLRTKVAGVSFKNGRKSRQTILRKIHFKDEPFDKGEMELSIEPYEYDGKPAFGVYVNGEQIGNIPAEHTEYVNANLARLDGVVNIDVYGGGGEEYNFGAEIILRFHK